MKIRDDKKIQRTNVIFSADLERYEGAVKKIRDAWENLPEDIEFHEREMFIEIASKVLFLQNRLREVEKDDRDIN